MTFNRTIHYFNLRKERRAWAIRLLGGKCAKCGSTKSLEFDHVDRTTKLFEISQKLLCAIKTLERELKKCQLLCKPCHSNKTAHENGVVGKHGTLSMYNNKGCRCDLCRSANTQRMKTRRALQA